MENITAPKTGTKRLMEVFARAICSLLDEPSTEQIFQLDAEGFLYIDESRFEKAFKSSDLIHEGTDLILPLMEIWSELNESNSFILKPVIEGKDEWEWVIDSDYLKAFLFYFLEKEVSEKCGWTFNGIHNEKTLPSIMLRDFITYLIESLSKQRAGHFDFWVNVLAFSQFMAMMPGTEFYAEITAEDLETEFELDDDVIKEIPEYDDEIPEPIQFEEFRGLTPSEFILNFA